MPDLGPVVGALGELVAPLISAFLRTTFGMFVFSVLLAGVSYKIAGSGGGSPWKPLLALGIVVVLSAILGTMLALKRAVLVALQQGVSKLQLGQRTLGALFTRILGLRGDAAQGDAGTRGNAAAKLVEKLPLERAEKLLEDAVSGLKKEDAQSGFLRAALHRALVDRIAAITLSRFRAAGEQAGGVDLVKVRDELSIRIEALLGALFDKAMLKLTLIIGLALAAGSLLLAFAIQRL